MLLNASHSALLPAYLFFPIHDVQEPLVFAVFNKACFAPQVLNSVIPKNFVDVGLYLFGSPSSTFIDPFKTLWFQVFPIKKRGVSRAVEGFICGLVPFVKPLFEIFLIFFHFDF